MSLFKRKSPVSLSEAPARNMGEIFPHEASVSSNVAQTAIPKGFRNGICGIARNVEKRELAAKQAWQTPSDYLSFRLERTDEVGNVIEQIPVEVRGEEIPGRIVRDGDTVIVKGRRNRHGLLDPKAIYVVNTNSTIKAKRHGFLWFLFAVPVGILGMASFFGLIAGPLIAIAGGEPTGWLIFVASIVGFCINYYFFNK